MSPVSTFLYHLLPSGELQLDEKKGYELIHNLTRIAPNLTKNRTDHGLHTFYRHATRRSPGGSILAAIGGP